MQYDPDTGTDLWSCQALCIRRVGHGTYMPQALTARQDTNSCLGHPGGTATVQTLKIASLQKFSMICFPGLNSLFFRGFGVSQGALEVCAVYKPPSPQISLFFFSSSLNLPFLLHSAPFLLKRRCPEEESHCPSRKTGTYRSMHT